MERQSSDVGPRFGQTCDQTAADRIDAHRKHNGNGRGRLLYCGDRASDCDDYVDVEPDKLGCDLGIAFGATLRRAILDRDGAVLDTAKFSEACHKSSRPWSKGRSICAQKPYGWQLSPCCARAASGHAAPPLRSVMNSRRLMSNIGGASNRLASPSVRLPSP